MLTVAFFFFEILVLLLSLLLSLVGCRCFCLLAVVKGGGDFLSAKLTHCRYLERFIEH